VTDGIKHRLVEVDDSVLVVIDIQDSFLSKYETAVSKALVARAVWIIQVARYLKVPIVAMAEDIARGGDLTRAIRDALPAECKTHDKDYFGLAGNPDILAAVDATGRKTAVLIGVETDVCVAQSAIGLMQNGYQVVVLGDAVATTQGSGEIGLTRMREAGAVISAVKPLYYEWQRSVSNCRILTAEAPELEKAKVPDCLAL